MGNILAPHNNVNNLAVDMYTVISQILDYDTGAMAQTNRYFARRLGPNTCAFQTNTVTPAELARPHEIITWLVVTTCVRWPVLPLTRKVGETDVSIDYQYCFPRLHHLVLQSSDTDWFEMDNNYTSFLKLLKDCSANLRSIEWTHIQFGHYKPTLELWKELMSVAVMVKHLKLSINVINGLRVRFVDTLQHVRHMHIVVGPEIRLDRYNSFPCEFLLNWATSPRTDDRRSLTLEIPEWNLSTQMILDFRLEVLGEGRSIEAVNMLAATRTDKLTAFILTTQAHVPTQNNSFDVDLLRRMNDWENTLECFIDSTTTVTLNFTLIATPDENPMEQLLLTKLMLYMTTRASVVYVNITIPEQHINYDSLLSRIAGIYDTVYTQNHRVFGGMVLTIQIVGPNPEILIYNENAYTSEVHMSAVIYMDRLE